LSFFKSKTGLYQILSQQNTYLPSGRRRKRNTHKRLIVENNQGDTNLKNLGDLRYKKV